jgi:hypothetical protein
MTAQEWQEINGLWARLAPFLGDEGAGCRRTTTQVKLGVSALRVVVELLETHAMVERGQA